MGEMTSKEARERLRQATDNYGAGWGELLYAAEALLDALDREEKEKTTRLMQMQKLHKYCTMCPDIHKEVFDAPGGDEGEQAGP